MKSRLFFLFVIAGAIACQPNKEVPMPGLDPAAEGFDWEHSDPAAIELADNILKEQGGRRACDETGYPSWNSFGRRNLVWDKQTAMVRIDETVPTKTFTEF
jgi:hypothetical protein